MKEIFHKYTGEMPEKVSVIEHPTAYGAKYDAGKLVVVKPKGKELTPDILHHIFKEKFNAGISPKHHGKELPVLESIPPALYHITKRLPTGLAKEIAKIPLHTYNSQDPESTKALYTYLPTSVKRNQEAVDLLDRRIKSGEGVALKSKSKEGGSIVHMVMNPSVGYTPKHIIYILGHEIGHLLHDKHKVHIPTPLFEYLNKFGIGESAKLYKDPVQRVRESVADFFGHLHKYAYANKIHSLEEALPRFIEDRKLEGKYLPYLLKSLLGR